MTKYSTGGASGGGDGDACELCGATDGRLREATVAGADLLVCGSCAPHADEDGGGEDRGDTGSSGEDRGRDSGPDMPETSELWDRDSSRWEEEGTDYESDRLPYLVSDYGEAVVNARQGAGYQREELAEELGVDAEDLLAVEQGRAARANVGGTVIAKLEEALDVELADE
jgi:ribosome-binding protein aMBF1 (putative translation factor)